MVIDLRDNLVWGIPAYSFWAGIGLMVALVVFLLLLLYKRIQLGKQIWVYSIGVLGVALGSILFGFLKNILVALYEGNDISIREALHTGLVYYGGLFGFLVFSKIGMFLLHLEMKADQFDLVAITIPVFHFFGRIGCFFAGCCYGIEYSGSFAVTYIYSSGDVVVRLPVQLIEALIEAIIFAYMLNLLRRRTVQSGQLINAYLASYAVARFILEFFRGDEVRGLFGHLSFSQIVSLLILLLLIVIRLTAKRDRSVIYEDC